MSRLGKTIAAPALGVTIVGMALCGTGAAAGRTGPLSGLFVHLGDYPLGASVNRTDYESVDAAARRLYISKMGGGQLLVFDIDRNKLVAQLDGFPKITGVLAVPELHKLYASVPGGGVLSSIAQGLGMAGLSSGHGEVAVLDTRSLKQLARIPGGVFPDGIAFDPRDKRVFVSDEMGSAVTAIDAATNRFVARIDTGGQVGNVRYDPASGDVFVPVQSRNELIRIGPAGKSVTGRYPLPDCDHPHGFIVAARAVGYVACDENDALLTIGLSNGRILNKQAVTHDPDVLAIDPEMSRLYVAGESGGLSSFDIAVPGSPKSLGDVFVAAGAHTLAVDPTTHRLYFALANLNGHAALRVLAPKPD